MPILTDAQKSNLNTAAQRVATGQAGASTATNAGDVANLEYAKRVYGYEPTLFSDVQTPPVVKAQQPYEYVSQKTNDPILDNLLKQAGQAAGGTVDDDQIKADTLRQFQQQIDTINLVYADKLNRARRFGEGNLGSAGAIQARSGLLGSDFGAAQTNNIREQNLQQQSLVDQERIAAINDLVNQSKSLAKQEIADKRAAIQKGGEDYLKYLSTVNESKDKNLGAVIASILQQGVDINTIDPAQLQNISNDLGVPVERIKAFYAEKKSELDTLNAKAAREGQFNLSPGQVRYDAQGNIIAEGAANDEGFELSPGQVRYDSKGNIIAQAAFRATGGGGGEGDSSTKATAAILKELQKFFGETDAFKIIEDVKTYGAYATMQSMIDNNASMDEINAFARAYGFAEKNALGSAAIFQNNTSPYNFNFDDTTKPTNLPIESSSESSSGNEQTP